MHQSAAPWRALEDPVAGDASDANPQSPGSHPRPFVWVALGTTALLVLIAFWLAASTSGGTVDVDGSTAVGEAAPSDGGLGPAASGVARGAPPLIVDVQGAVVRPGVVHLPPGSRVGDAIAAAGGFGARVAADRVGRDLNLAALLRDGDKVVVPSRDDPAPGGGSGGSIGAGASHAPGPVDLNRAPASELDALPGIGPVTANKIIAARDERPFATVDDLRTRKILGAAAFAKIKDLVVVR